MHDRGLVRLRGSYFKTRNNNDSHTWLFCGNWRAEFNCDVAAAALVGAAAVVAVAVAVVVVAAVVVSKST